MSIKGKLIKGAIGATAVWAGAGYGVVNYVFSKMFAHWTPEKYTCRIRYNEVEKDYPRKSMYFYSGSNRLQAYVYGENNTKGLIVFSHGIFACHEDYLGTVIEFVDRGWRVFAFDNTGTGESEGKDSVGLVQGPLDLHAALCFVESNPEFAGMKKFLLGHSQGGYSVCAVLNFDHKIDGVVSLAGFTTPIDVSIEMGHSMYGKAIDAAIPMMKLELSKRFGIYSNLSAVEGINRYKGPVLIMHGDADTYVRYDGVGLINHQQEIKNPDAVFSAVKGETCTHVGLFHSPESWKYQEAVELKLSALRGIYNVKENRDIPENELQKLFAEVDKKVANIPNKPMYDEINEFLLGLL